VPIRLFSSSWCKMKINAFQFTAAGILLLSSAIDAQQIKFLRKNEIGGTQQEIQVKKSPGVNARSTTTTGVVKKLNNKESSVKSGSSEEFGIIKLLDSKSIPDDNNVEAHLKLKTVAEQKKVEASSKASMESSLKEIKDTPMTHSQLNTIVRKKTQPKNGNRKLTSTGIRRRLSKPCNGLRKIVQCKDGVPEEVCKNDLLDAGVEVLADMHKTVFFAVCVESEKEANIVKELTDIEDVEDDPERTLSYLPESEIVRHLQADEQVVPYGVKMLRAPEFWDKYNKKGEGVMVCVIDTGIRATHEDLKDGELTGTNDPDLVTPWDADGNSHGTHCSGIIASQDNAQGVIGVAPGASIHTVRVFDNSGLFSASDLIEAMNACAEAGANIISMSLGGPVNTAFENAEITRLKDQGILVVAASGNDGNGANRVEYPAGYDSVMGVGAADANSEIASFSTYNSEVDVAGPGVDVLSTTSTSDSSYSEFSGTSMAAPHVAALAALLWSQFPDKSVDEIRDAIQKSARDVGACGKDRLFGHGMVDVVAAAAFLENNSNVATEISGCIDVEISLLTDDWGQETTYLVVPKDGSGGIVYRGGPYPNGRRVTYTDRIQLESGCYNLMVLDSYGDGSTNPEYGVGEVRVSYNGIQQFAFNSFEGASATLSFGSCGEDSIPTPVPEPDQTLAPVDSFVMCGNVIQEEGE
jgi:subtilisin family serine protease